MTSLFQNDNWSAIAGKSSINWSAFAGSMSIACWILVYTPQLIENYRRKSGEGLSLGFLLVWLLGDSMNLMGVIMEDLLFTQFLLGVYYVCADVCIISQVYYYRAKRLEQIEEATPLLDNGESRRLFSPFDILVVVMTVMMVISLVGVYSFWDASSVGKTLADNYLKWVPRIVGWSSCLFYLCSRMPQIIKNFRQKSCEGLSPFLFFFAVLGNTSYILSILLHSLESRYLLINMPWLLGSFGTLLFDFTIFVQFILFHGNHNAALDEVQAIRVDRARLVKSNSFSRTIQIST
ncbi:uncharacterized protein VTP21DRAFT_7290 [Calcarisporiella thermophila]|uniref:uncharacterized protein n=1 Tax=Calcarisporiella thermophila TaxID=911321 RepID=UPI0037449787